MPTPRTMPHTLPLRHTVLIVLVLVCVVSLSVFEGGDLEI